MADDINDGMVENYTTDAVRTSPHPTRAGYKIMSNGKGYVSANGLRTFRFPANKRGVNPATGEPWSKTGRQLNVETKAARGEPPTSNVHLDVYSILGSSSYEKEVDFKFYFFLRVGIPNQTKNS